MSQYCIAELKFDDDGKLTVERAFAPGQITQVVHAHWEDCSNGWMCSNCQRDSSHDTRYCPYCGARMDEEINDA